MTAAVVAYIVVSPVVSIGLFLWLRPDRPTPLKLNLESTR